MLDSVFSRKCLISHYRNLYSGKISCHEHYKAGSNEGIKPFEPSLAFTNILNLSTLPRSVKNSFCKVRTLYLRSSRSTRVLGGFFDKFPCRFCLTPLGNSDRLNFSLCHRKKIYVKILPCKQSFLKS